MTFSFVYLPGYPYTMKNFHITLNSVTIPATPQWRERIFRPGHPARKTEIVY